METITELFERYPSLAMCGENLTAALDLLKKTYHGGGKFLFCGNGGSAADCEHIVGELMKGFLLPRPMADADKKAFLDLYPDDRFVVDHLQGGIPAIALVSHTALSTAWSNDAPPELCYAEQVYGYGRPGDLFMGISTSGNAKNVTYAAKIAHARGLYTIGLTGARESTLSAICDVTIRVPETETYKVQELHLPVYHWLCAALEEEAFGKKPQCGITKTLITGVHENENQ